MRSVKMISTDDERRFWAKVRKTDECWHWLGSLAGRTGYGQARVAGRTVGAHRVSVMLDGRTIPDGALVCHTCDIRACVNPAHLFVGSAADNVRDMVAKGRHSSRVRPETVRRGEQINTARLTAEQVRLVRKRLREIQNDCVVGREFGVSRDIVRNIRVGRAWSHVGDAP